MIANELTYQELEIVIKQIIMLEKLDTIYSNVAKLFHIPDCNNWNEYHWNIYNANEYKGIKTTYKGFELQLNSHSYFGKENESPRTFLDFQKKKSSFEKSIIGIFLNHKKKIVNDIIKICIAEIEEIKFDKTNIYSPHKPYSLGGDSTIEAFYQKDTGIDKWNDNWMNEGTNKISPITIITIENDDFIRIQFHFTPACYERKYKTILKKEWREIFKSSRPFWMININ
jgi:hypothetical protein